MKSRQGKTGNVAWLHTYRYWLVFAFSFLLYVNTVPNKYNLDDELVTTTEPDTPHRLTSKGISAIPEIIREPYYKDDQGYSYEYRPVVLITYAIENSLFGNNIHLSHLINALLYGLLCALLLLVLSSFLKDYSILLPLLVTLIFAAHPAHTEVVASAKNRDEILAMSFALLSALFLLPLAGWKSFAGFLLSLAFFALAVFSKSTIVVFALITPLLGLLFSRIGLKTALAYALLAIAVFMPVSSLPFTKIAYATAGSVAALVFPYLIIHPLNFDFRKRIQKLWITASSVAESNDFYRPFALPVSAAVVCVGFLLASSAALYFLRISYYLLPVTFLLPLPFLIADSAKRKWFLGIVACAALPGLILLRASYVSFDAGHPGYDALTAAYFLYAAYFISSKNFRLSWLFLLLLMALNFLLSSDVGIPVLILLVLFIPEHRKYVRFLKYLPAAILLVEFIYYLKSGPQGYSDFFSPGTVTLVILILLALLPAYKKFIWIIICLHIIGTTALCIRYTGLKEFYPVKQNLVDLGTELKIKSDKTLPPQIIPRSSMDRPISLIESPTTPSDPLEYKLGTTAQVFRKYLRLTLLPYPLSFYYGYKVIDKQSVLSSFNILTMVVYAFFLLAAIFFLKKNKLLSAALLIYLISLSVYSNLILPIPGTMADRFLFIPSLGFALFLGWVFLKIFHVDLHEKKYTLDWATIPRGLKLASGVLLLFYSTATVARNRSWHDHLTLFQTDIPHLENSSQANSLYAGHLVKYSFSETNPDKQRAMRELAEKHFIQALFVFDDFFNARYNLARVEVLLGKNNEAERNFYLASKLNPDYSYSWRSAIELAIAARHYRDARKYCMEAAAHLNDPAFYDQFSYSYFAEAKYDSAIIFAKEAAKRFPAVSDFPFNIGQTYQHLGNLDSALVYHEKALALSPGNSAIIKALDVLTALKNQQSAPKK